MAGFALHFSWSNIFSAFVCVCVFAFGNPSIFRLSTAQMRKGFFCALNISGVDDDEKSIYIMYASYA